MSNVVILGVFVADTSFRADRLPKIGETVLGQNFVLGPGGKGSNQAVASARAGMQTHIITRLGRDAFADMALEIWREAGVTPAITRHPESYTGAAFIFVEAHTGNNAIVISPGAAGTISEADIEARAELIGNAGVFITQLEQPLAAARRALQMAREGGAITILNPAPAAALPEGMLGLCDYVTPNEIEAEALTGIRVISMDNASKAAAALVAAGAGAAIITLGEKGALYYNGSETVHVPAYDAGTVVETTGAGDAFNGAFAAALAKGLAPEDAVRFGCAAASISVTRAGTAPSMPGGGEIRALLARNS